MRAGSTHSSWGCIRPYQDSFLLILFAWVCLKVGPWPLHLHLLALCFRIETQRINSTTLTLVTLDSPRSTRWQIQVAFCLLWPTLCTQDVFGKPPLALWLEGSANKLGPGVIQTFTKWLSKCFIQRSTHLHNTTWEGFLLHDIAQHHRLWDLRVIWDAIEEAGIRIKDLGCICYTKGKLLLLSAFLPHK